MFGGVAAIAGGLAAFAGINARIAERRAPRDGRMIDLDGARLHYVDIGSGPTIVMVHGLGGQIRNFTHSLTERLAGDFRIILLDRPGSGYSVAAQDGQQGLRAQAALIAQFLRKLNVDRSLLVGHSLGGALSLALAVEQPETIAGLALISPLSQPLGATPKAFSALEIDKPWLRHAIAWSLAAPMAKLTRTRMRELLFGPDPIPDDFDSRGGGGLTLRPSAFSAASAEVCWGTDELIELSARYAELEMPVGIVFGRGDRILAAEEHGERTAAAIDEAELLLIDGGHMIPITKPDAIADWLRGQAARAGIVEEAPTDKRPLLGTVSSA